MRAHVRVVTSLSLSELWGSETGWPWCVTDAGLTHLHRLLLFTLPLSAFPNIRALPWPFVTALKSLSGPSQDHSALVSLPPPPSSPDTSFYSHCPHSTVHLPCAILRGRRTLLCMFFNTRTVKTIVGLSSVIVWPLTHVACFLSMPVYWEVEWRDKMNWTWCL